MRCLVMAIGWGLAAGCADAPGHVAAGSPASLDGAWTVEDLDHGGIPDDAEVTIEFAANGKLSGRSACNRYGGDFTYEAGVLTTAALFSTKMACPPALMDLEVKFLNRLEGELNVSQQADETLALSDQEGRILIRPAS